MWYVILSKNLALFPTDLIGTCELIMVNVGWFLDIHLLKEGGGTDVFTGFFHLGELCLAINNYKYRDSRE